ncbi:Holliday junction branch migration protein RuvA [Pseudonocardia sp. Cha107L01]|uniref:Holliday junction branch migration protein RuvA n=1 Tax=Pseudonocardia sp. Cha107L01 TaxID=3457576 RepID=UPI00403EF4A3
MISSVRGPVLTIGLDHAVVEVGGVGLAVHATPGTLATLRRGEEARLATTLVVREDSLTLYGFANAEAGELFRLLQTVTGVGPRLALSILAVLEPDALCRALADGDTAALKRVPGVGLKSAERLVLELRDKVVAVARVPVGGGVTAPVSGRDHVVEALTGLGFAVRQAEQAVDAVLAETTNGGSVDTAATLRTALSRLGKAR